MSFARSTWVAVDGNDGILNIATSSDPHISLNDGFYQIAGEIATKWDLQIHKNSISDKYLGRIDINLKFVLWIRIIYH